MNEGKPMDPQRYDVKKAAEAMTALAEVVAVRKMNAEIEEGVDNVEKEQPREEQRPAD